MYKYFSSVSELPLQILCVGYTVSLLDAEWLVHEAVASDFPSALRFDNFGYSTLVLPVESKNDAEAANDRVRKVVDHFGGKVCPTPQQLGKVALYLQETMHEDDTHVETLPPDDLLNFTKTMAVPFGSVTEQHVLGFPQYGNEEAGFDNYRALLFNKTTERDLMDIQAMCRRLIVLNYRIPLSRVLVTCGGRGVWLERPTPVLLKRSAAGSSSAGEAANE